MSFFRQIENRSLYFPTKGLETQPTDMGLEYENVFVRTEDGQSLHGWWISSKESKLVVVFFHGNGGNISHRLEKARLLVDLGAHVFLMDYRGYGRSTGSPSEEGLYKDSLAIWKYVTVSRNWPSEKITLYGESLGGAVAIDLASRKPVGTLITENTFTSIADMLRHLYPQIPGFLIQSKYDSLTKIKQLTCRKLLIQSIDDDIIPFDMGKTLFEAAREPKLFKKVHGSHNTSFFDSREIYVEAIGAFLKESLWRPSSL